MLHEYQAQNEAMQILGTSEPEILEFCPTKFWLEQNQNQKRNNIL